MQGYVYDDRSANVLGGVAGQGGRDDRGHSCAGEARRRSETGRQVPRRSASILVGNAHAIRIYRFARAAGWTWVRIAPVDALLRLSAAVGSSQ